MKTKVNGIFTLLLAFVVHLTFAQDKTISGTVTDQDGLPLPGVNIVVIGTTSGTQTDFDGNYNINANTGETLLFTYVGQTNKKVAVGANSTINVQMSEDAEALEEVVVTALGITRNEKALGYSTQQVGSEELTTVRDKNIVNSLSGKIAGINVTSSSGAVGAESRIVIRGISSISGNAQPLMIVDGVVIDNSSYGNSGSGGGYSTPNGLADINQDDIATINVLKGGAATSLYGMRGANGVIVITTKTGKKGTDKLGIEISSSVSIENAYILPNYQNSYGQGTNQQYFEFIDGVQGDGGVDESWGPALDVGLEFVQWNSVNGEPLPWVSQPDNVKDFYQTGLTTNNNIAFTKSGDGYSARMSAGLTDTKGILFNTGLKKYNIGGRVDFDLSDKWSAGLNISYIKTESDNLPSVGYGDSNNQIGQIVWSGRNVDFAALKDYENLPTGFSAGTTDATPINWNLAYNNNPYWTLATNTNTFDRNRMLGNVNIAYQVSDKISITAQSGIDYFSSLDTQRRAFGTNGTPRGSYDEQQRTRYEINTQVLASYNTSISEKMKFSLSLGGNKMVNDYHRITMSAPELQVPNLYNISNTRDGVNPVLVQEQTDSRINSVFGFTQLSFDDMIFLDITARNDWASVLPIANNSFFYPGANLSVLLSDLFSINNNYVSFLKLRGGWAQVGSAGPLAAYSLEPSFEYSTDTWGGTPVALSPATLWNPNIKNETTTEFEFGFDARFLNNRLRLDATYYNKETKDVIMNKLISASSGNTGFWDNAATIKNEGLELTLGADIIKSKDFNLSMNVNFALNRNRVNDIDDDPTTNVGTVVLGELWNADIVAREGEAVGAIYGPGFLRNDDGAIIYENGIAQIDPDLKVLGNINPDWTGGLGINMNYKNFSFSTLFDVKMGGDIYSQTNTWGKLSGILEETAVGRESGVVGEGVVYNAASDSYSPNTVVVPAQTFYSSTYSQNVIESSVYDASFVKWREISLSYALPKTFIQNTGVDDISLGLTVRNLAILYKEVPHIDPESAFSSSTGQQGLEYAQIPATRSIGFNLNVKF